MTSEAQRIAIAEACGHKWYRYVKGQTEQGYFVWGLKLATAAQRAEAFLRTIGKWVES